MTKKFTPIKDVKEHHAVIVREHEREKIERAIAAAVHLGHSEVATHGMKIDVPLALELKEAGYEYVRALNKIKW